jgi:phospho-N-acetylmuramoyl-pentapeptide-transferase
MNHELVIRILTPTALAFLLGIVLTPFFSNIFYRYRLWKRSSRIDEQDNPKMLAEGGEDMKKVYNQQETKTPRVGGIIVWASFLLVIILTELWFVLFPESTDLRFITRGQTLLPLGSLIAGAVLGLTDDFLQIFGSKTSLAIGVPRKIRIALVATLGVIEGLWFVHKLGYSAISLPFDLGSIELGIFFVPFFMITLLALFSSSIIDGIDGLAAGVLAIIFNTYGFIGIIQGQFGIAIFAFTLMGALLAFLWFNVPPARFYLGETGILALTLPLTVLIFLTNTVFEFLVIGLPLVLTALSTVIQIIGRRVFKVRVFRLAPLHHHFEALGWPRSKITMRYWIFSAMCSLIGLIIVLS